jgi:UDP-N-acetylmuramoyl-tripeptide--D-alanyl-D-alanine ligase
MIYSIIKRKYRTGTSRKNLNTETGLPLTLFTFDEKMTHAVVEMGMDGPGQISRLVEIFKPDIAVITNIGITHMERLGSRENIFKAKMEITEGMGTENILIINNDDDKLRTLKDEDLPYKIIGAGTSPDSDFVVSDIEDLGERGVRFSLTSPEGTMPIRLAIPGAHNAINAALAAATASSIGISIEDITAGLARTETTGNRLRIFTAGNIKIIDDSYNAAPQSVKSAINTLMKSEGNRKVAIIGDMNELGEKSPELHEEVGSFAAEAGVDALISIGEKARRVADAAERGPNGIPVRRFDRKEDMYPHIREILKEGDTVLVKGSRLIELENLTDKIREAFL